MTTHPEKLAPMNITKQQKKYLKNKSHKTGVPVTTIVRQLIDKAIEADK